jgi:hypothetical protein
MSKHFDVVIVDEAAQAVEPSVMVPLVMGCKQVGGGHALGTCSHIHTCSHTQYMLTHSHIHTLHMHPYAHTLTHAHGYQSNAATGHGPHSRYHMVHSLGMQHGALTQYGMHPDMPP